MNLKSFFICIIISFTIWVIPFCIRLSINVENQKIFVNKQKDKKNPQNIMIDISKEYSKGNRKEVFHLIFLNNFKVVLLNIFGGIFLGLGTFVNLAQNGFYSADVFCSVHNSGMSWSKIIEYTAPHSFEMIGIWMSGGVGFYIAMLMIDAMVKNKYPTKLNCKIILISTLSIALIILFAAYIEAFVSV